MSLFTNRSQPPTDGRHPLPAGGPGNGTAGPIAVEQHRVESLIDDIRARSDALIDEQADRLERWQEEQEARFTRSLVQQREWFEQRLAELDAATKGAGGTVQQAAQRAIAGIDEAVVRARAECERVTAALASAVSQSQSTIERAAAQSHRLATDAVRAIADGRATVEQTSTDAAAAAERCITQVKESIAAATLEARRAAATIEERLAHHCASLATRANEAIAHAATPAAASTQPVVHLLQELVARAEHVAGIPTPETAMPAHEAPAPWPPAPLPGSLADLVARGQAIATRGRRLINDLARQTAAGESVRETLEGTAQDVAATVRAHREQLDQIRELSTAGFEAGFELETVLGDAIVEARTAADRLDNARDAGSALRTSLAEARRVTAAIDERLAVLREQGQRLTGVVQSLRSVVDGGESKAA